MAQIHMIEGPVGAGKSTFAIALGKRHRSPPLILDDWMATLFRADRPASDFMAWYAERKQRCIDQIWKLAVGLLDLDSDAILELGLVQRADRTRFYERIAAAGSAFTVYVLDAPPAVRRQRVRRRNREKGNTYVMEVSDEVFELASSLWEPPEEAECAGRDIRFLSTDGTNAVQRSEWPKG